MSNSNFPNVGKLYMQHVMPVQIDCSFVVDQANVNGLGLKTILGQGIGNIYMHSTAAFTGTSHTSTLIDGITSTANLAVGMSVQGSGIPALTTIKSIIDGVSITLSAATSSSVTGSITYQGVGSPQPAAGLIVVKLSSSYNAFYGMQQSFVGPQATASTSTVANVINVISVLGTATLAQWQAVGLPVGVTPAVGVAFIANQSAAIGGSAQTILATAAGVGIDHIESLGNANLSIGPTGSRITNSLSGKGSLLYLRCYKNTVLTQPTDASQINLSFLLGNSGVQVGGW